MYNVTLVETNKQTKNPPTKKKQNRKAKTAMARWTYMYLRGATSCDRGETR